MMQIIMWAGGNSIWRVLMVVIIGKEMANCIMNLIATTPLTHDRRIQLEGAVTQQRTSSLQASRRRQMRCAKFRQLSFRLAVLTSLIKC